MKLAAALTLLVLAQATAQPPRDSRAVANTPAISIGGQVVDDTGAPLPAAWIVLAGGPPPGARTAITTEAGRYRIDGVPPGLYTIELGKPGYPRVRHGQRRANGPGTVVEVGSQPLSLRLVLPRGASISGTLVDDDGQPHAGSLRASAEPPSAASRAFAVHAITDGRGAFRISGVSAGAYRITSRPPSERYETEPSGGIVVTVAAGEERQNVIVPAARATPLTYVTVSAAPSDGTTARSFQVVLRRRGEANPIYRPSRPNADGTSTISDVSAGTYLVVARNGPYIGGAEVVVDGEHPAAVTIAMSRGARVSGTVTFDEATPSRARMPSIAFTPADAEGLLDDNNGATSPIDQEGRFSMTMPAGRYVMRVYASERDGWRLQSARWRDQDVTDVPVTVGAEGIEGMSVALTRVRSQLRGRATDASGTPLNGVDVVAFPIERKYLVRGSRRVRAARTGLDGGFEIADLPAGEYALAVVDEVDRQALREPSAVEQLRPLTAVKIGPGETAVQNVTVK